MSATVTERPAGASPSAGPAVTRPDVPDDLRRRLVPPMPTDGWTSWAWALAITGIAAILRLIALTRPRGPVDEKTGVVKPEIFDEIYYRKDAYDLLIAGHELNAERTGPGFVAHPPMGKWCIALGQAIFGDTPFGWRISAVVFGAISILLLIRIVRLMFRSTLLGCFAGLLMTFDGLHFVQSRAALLDIFLMTFLLAAFGCLVVDRELRRRAVLAGIAAGADTSRGLPARRLATAPWLRLAAGVFMGLALGVKWSAVWYLVAFAVLALGWEIGVRRTAGVRRPWGSALIHETGWLAAYGGAAVLAYLATWTGWFVTDTGWDRRWAETTGNSVPLIPDALVNLWHYHQGVLNFHVNLSAQHTYQSTPWSWLLLGRPVAYAYSDDGPCGAATCSAETLALGTPALWWSFVPLLVGAAWLWISRRDWRAAAALAGVATCVLPWLAFPARTMFFFYALPALPFCIIAVTCVAAAVLGGPGATPERRAVGAAVVGGYVAVVALTFAYFYPIYTSDPIPYESWRARMWLESWI